MAARDFGVFRVHLNKGRRVTSRPAIDRRER
jgi:hypothetical protein